MMKTHHGVHIVRSFFVSIHSFERAAAVAAATGMTDCVIRSFGATARRPARTSRTAGRRPSLADIAIVVRTNRKIPPV